MKLLELFAGSRSVGNEAEKQGFEVFSIDWTPYDKINLTIDIGELKKEDTYVYLSSSWATPIIDIDGEEFDCWILKGDSKYESDTYWPSEAENLLFNGVLSIDA